MAFKMLTEADYLAAVERGRIADENEPRATSAWYDEASGRIFMELKNGCLFAFPSEMGQGLRGATARQLSEVEILPGGEALHWEELDADLGVQGLVAGVFGSKAWLALACWGARAAACRARPRRAPRARTARRAGARARHPPRVWRRPRARRSRPRGSAGWRKPGGMFDRRPRRRWG